MATPNITPRRVLQDLGYAPRLNAPEPILQPSPQITLPAKDTETTQLVAALGEINKQVTVYAGNYTDQREQADIENAAANSIKLLDEAKANQTKTGQALQSYVDANMVNYGSSPKVRKYLYTMLGEHQATQEYTKLLEESRNRVANNLKPENADDVITEIRQKFLTGLGDNMFSRAGAESVMKQADAAFRGLARAQQDQFIKENTLTQIDVRIGQIATEGVQLNNPAVTAANLYQQRNDLKQAGIGDADQVWAQSIKNVLINLAVKGHGTEVRAIIEQLKPQAVKTTDASGKETIVGTLGESASMGAFFENLDAAVLKAATQKDDMDSAVYDSRKRVISNLATEMVDNAFGEAGANPDHNDPKIQASIDAGIERVAKTPGEKAELRRLTNQAVQKTVSDLSRPTPIDAVISYQAAVDKNDFALADSIFKTFSKADLVAFHDKHQFFLDNSRIINSPTIKAAGALLQQKLKESLKFTETDPDASVKYAVMISANAEYQRAIINIAKTDRDNWKGLSNEEIVARVDGLAGNEGELILQKSTKAYENSKSILKATGEPATSVPRPLTKGQKPVSETKNYTNEEQLNAVFAWTKTQSQLQEDSGLSMQFTNPKSAKFALQTQDSINKMATAMMPNLVSMVTSGVDRNGVVVSPQTRQAATEAYLALKKTQGYTPQEILSGRTSQGVSVDVAKLVTEQPNFAYTTKFFTTQQGLAKAITDYSSLVQELSVATTDEQKQVIEYKIRTNPYYQIKTKLIPTSGVKTIDTNNEYTFVTNQKAMLPYGPTPQASKPTNAMPSRAPNDLIPTQSYTGEELKREVTLSGMSVTEFFINEAAGKGALKPTTERMTLQEEMSKRLIFAMQRKMIPSGKQPTPEALQTQFVKLSPIEREQTYAKVILDMKNNVTPPIVHKYKEMEGFFTPKAEWFLFDSTNSVVAPTPVVKPVAAPVKVKQKPPEVVPLTDKERDNERFLLNNYNTTLDADNEKRFQSWLRKQSGDMRSYRNGALYDLRGYWLNGGDKSKATKIPDAYKKPERPTQ